MTTQRLQGIKYRWKRAFGATEYDREREKEREEEENPDKSLSKAIVSSLEVNAVTDLPIYIGVRVAMLLYILVAAIFVYLVLSGYDRIHKEKFLSLSKNDICEELPKEVFGMYLADSSGNWEGDPDFEYSKALYAFDFKGLQSSYDNFRNVIDLSMKRIEIMNQVLEKENLAMTILVWTTWFFDSRTVNSDEKDFSFDDKAHYFYLTGSVKSVFNQAAVYSTSLNNADGECDIAGIVTYEKTASLFRITYPSTEEYLSNSHCMDILDIRTIGYNTQSLSPDFDIVLDAATVMVSVAVNLGIIDLQMLELVPHSQGFYNMTTLVEGPELIGYGRYYHPGFPNMDTLYCLTELSGAALSCGIYLYSLRMIPVFNHLGYYDEISKGDLNYCSCDPSFNEQIKLNCNGFIFYNYNFSEDNGSGYKQSDDNYELLADKYRSQFYSLNLDAYNISKESAVRGYPADQESRESIYNFCTEGMSRGCSIMTVTAFSSGTEASISENYYQVPWGHCNDTTTISEAAKQKLYVPPVRLTEVYYECKVSKLEAFVTAVGISSGNALSVKLLFVVLLTALLAGRKTGTRKTGSYRTYGVEEREEALHYFAFSLLSARDGRHLGGSSGGDGGTGGEEESVLRGLSEELSHERRIHRFFPAASTGAGDLSTEQKTPADETDQSADVSAELPGRVSQKIRQKKTAAFQSEMLSNPFYVPSKVDLVK